MSIDELLKKGYSHKSILTYLLKLNGGIKDYNLENEEIEILSNKQMIERFDYSTIVNHNSIFDIARLNHMQKQINNNAMLSEMPKLLSEARSSLAKLRKNCHPISDEKLKTFLSQNLNEYFNVESIIANPRFDFVFGDQELNLSKLENLGLVEFLESYLEKICRKKDKKPPEFAAQLRNYLKINNRNSKDFAECMKALRMSLTNHESGPPIAELFQIIDSEHVLSKIKEFKFRKSKIANTQSEV